MNDVKTSLRPIEWTESVRIIDKNSLFPMVVKPTLNTAKIYEISQDPVLLHDFWITQRVVAQSLEDEGAYVVGPQLEIPAEYSGTFGYKDNQKGNEDVVQNFASVKDIALSMPEKVFTQQRLVVYPQILQEEAAAKVPSLILEPLEQLTVIEKKDVDVLLPVSRFVFSGKPKYKNVPVQCVTFLVENTKRTINLPVTTRGSFSTLPYIPKSGREFGMRGIISGIDFPINLTTSRNCPQSMLDEHHLRAEMRLRFTAIEEHEVILGVTTQEKIVEFSANDVEFIMPKHLDGSEDQEIEYQTALQRFLMECQIKNSPVNIKDYRKSIRTHISRTVRVTNPTALSQVSRNRICKFNPSLRTEQNGMPAIAFFSSTSNQPNSSRRSSLPPDSHRLLRHSMPLPAPPMTDPDIPPLPPRNSRNRYSLKSPRQFSPQPSFSARPDLIFDDWVDLPNRPPPLPPTSMESTPDRSKLSSVGSGTDTSFSTTSSTASPEEHQVWEALDENYLQKLREDRDLLTIKQTPLSYENFTPIGQTQERPVVDGNEAPSLITFIEPERSESPQFALPVNAQSAIDIPDETPAAVSIFNNANNCDNEIQHQQITNTQSYENFSPLHLNNAVGNDLVKLPTDLNINQMEDEIVPGLSFGESFTEPEGQRKNSVSSTSNDESDNSGEDSLQRSSSSASNDSKMEEKRNGYFHVSQYSVVSEDSNPSTQLSFTCNYVPAPQDWTPPSDLTQLSVSQVADSLRYIGMNEDTVEWFRAEKVDGQLLCLIGDEEFTQHFRLTPFQRKKIVMFLKGWRPKVD